MMPANLQNEPRSNPILRFFLGERVHPNGKTIHEILNMNEPRIGHTGGVIQWLFPLTTPSTHVPSAPTLSPSELQMFRVEPKLRKLYIIGVNRFLELYGIALHGSSASLEPEFNIKRKWMYPRSHAYIPITRILKSLKLLGFSAEFTTLSKLLLLCNERGGGNLIDKSTLDTWEHV
jgi:hypothetical protein